MNDYKLNFYKIFSNFVLSKVTHEFLATKYGKYEESDFSFILSLVNGINTSKLNVTSRYREKIFLSYFLSMVTRYFRNQDEETFHDLVTSLMSPSADRALEVGLLESLRAIVCQKMAHLMDINFFNKYKEVIEGISTERFPLNENVDSASQSSPSYSNEDFYNDICKLIENTTFINNPSILFEICKNYEIFITNGEEIELINHLLLLKKRKIDLDLSLSGSKNGLSTSNSNKNVPKKPKYNPSKPEETKDQKMKEDDDDEYDDDDDDDDSDSEPTAKEPKRIFFKTPPKSKEKAEDKVKENGNNDVRLAIEDNSRPPEGDGDGEQLNGSGKKTKKRLLLSKNLNLLNNSSDESIDNLDFDMSKTSKDIKDVLKTKAKPSTTTAHSPSTLRDKIETSSPIKKRDGFATSSSSITVERHRKISDGSGGNPKKVEKILKAKDDVDDENSDGECETSVRKQPAKKPSKTGQNTSKREEMHKSSSDFSFDSVDSDRENATNPIKPKGKNRHSMSSSTRRPWSNTETLFLCIGVELYGKGNWGKIIQTYKSKFNQRTGVHLKDKYRNLERSNELTKFEKEARLYMEKHKNELKVLEKNQF